MSVARWIKRLLFVLVLVVSGCKPPAPVEAPPSPPSTKAVEKAVPTPSRPAVKKRKARESVVEKAPPGPESPEYATPPEKLAQGIIERVDAARMLVTMIRESVAYGPTLVVWLVDRSGSSREMVMDMGRLIEALSPDLAAINGKVAGIDDAKLLTAVCSFGVDVRFDVDPPSSDPKAITNMLAQVTPDTTGKEATFAAVKAALEKYLPYRTEKRREVVFVILTDEAGDDLELLDGIVDGPRKAGVPFYVVGVPAPFGKEAAISSSVEVGLDYKPDGKWLAIRQGPESRMPERVRLGFWGGGTGDIEFLDSGFGPFGLERLCRATGGRYIALRPGPREFELVSAIGIEWPSSAAVRFDAATMRRYAPDYVPDQEYQSLLANKARRAVVDAAQLSEVELLEFPKTSFVKADEAAMARMLSEAQQVAAKLSPTVDRLYDALERGEADRARLTDPRWQANFDLAMGRAASAKAKVDGYNHMLAALKRGKSFANPSSTTWMLEPSDSIEDASALQKLIDKGKASLQRVVDQHAGTPWAKIAERELETPSGWKWTEQ